MVEVVERAHSQVVGRLLLGVRRGHGGAGLDPRLTPRMLLIPLERIRRRQTRPDRWLPESTSRQPWSAARSARSPLFLAMPMSREFATDMAIFSHDLTFEFPQPVLDAAEAFGDRIRSEAGRKTQGTCVICRW